MYLDHFKLSSKPFNNCPGDGFFTPNEEYESAVTRMEQVLLSRDAVAVVTGGPGVGKTTLVATAANRAGEKAMVAYVDMRLTDPDLLYDLLILSLGGESGGDQATSLHRLKSVIAKHNDEQDRRITAVIDVSSLTIERAKRILQLVHMAGEPGGQLNVILLGPHVLHKLLDTPGLIHMRQRVTFRYRVRPLTVAETEAYLNEQLQKAGGQADSILVHGTSIMVYRYVGGVPRLINTLMDATLSHAVGKGAQSVSSDMVTQVAQLLGWRRLSGKKSTNQAAAPAPTANVSPEKETVDATQFTRRKQEDPSPLDASVSNTETTDVAEENPANAAPVSEGTAMLMAASLDSSPKSADDKLELKIEDTASKPNSASNDSNNDQESNQGSSMPEMDASDTSATGMLRLEDLDARFAETVFGDDTGMFKIDGDSDIKKATG